MKNPPASPRVGASAAPAAAPSQALPVGTVAVVGLGYVGLPLAVAFARRYPTIGFDLAQARSRRIAKSTIRPAR
jgi:hypothetical protein